MLSQDVVIVAVVFFSFVAIVKIVTENRIRRLLIDRGKLDESTKYLYASKIENEPLSAFKWGLVLIGIGVALFLGELFPSTFSEEGMVGLMFLFAGIGFLIYYYMAKRQLREKTE